MPLTCEELEKRMTPRKQKFLLKLKRIKE